MTALRTPDDRFAGLDDFPYDPAYTEVADPDHGPMRIAHVDVGTSDTGPVLCLHGEPSWSYLYRKMIPVFEDAGYRTVAPDLIGFGRSDKPTERTDYTYANHVRWMTDWLVANNLTDITLVCQDWGGLIGLRLAAAMPDRFARIVVANTMLPTGDHDPGEGFKKWQKFSQEVPDFTVGKIIFGGTVNKLSDAEIAAYDAPFPDDSYKAGARQFPMLVPITPDDPESNANRAAWGVLGAWDKPVLTCFSDQDAVTAGGDKVMQKLIPGCAGQPHTVMKGGGHFLQEDVGPALAAHIVSWMNGLK